MPEPPSNGDVSIRGSIAAAYDAHAGDLFRYALMLLADHGAAEDAVHEVFAKLANRGEAMLQIESLNGYLRAAVRNTCYRTIRQRQRRGREVGLSPARPLLAPTPMLGRGIDEQEWQAVEAVLRGLPPEQREVVYLKVYEELTFRQISEVLGISINTSASRYRYAMEKLRRVSAKDE